MRSLQKATMACPWHQRRSFGSRQSLSGHCKGCPSLDAGSACSCSTPRPWCLSGRDLPRSEGPSHPLHEADGIRDASRRARTPNQRPTFPRHSTEARAEGATTLCVPKSVRWGADGHRTTSRDPGPGPRLTLTWLCDLGPVSYPLWAQFLPL